MKNILVVFFVVLSFVACSAVTNKKKPDDDRSPQNSTKMNVDQFNALINSINEQKYNKVEKFLHENERNLVRDPEYYVILLNYVLSKGNQSVVVVAKGEPKDGDLKLSSKESGEQIGFIGEREKYDHKMIIDGISKTQDAMKHFQSRLDIHFGIIVAAESIKNWKILGDQLMEILRTSKKIDNKWSWGSVNKEKTIDKKFMLENVQNRISNLFHVNTPSADDQILRVSREMIKYYPTLVYGYGNLGALYAAKKQYDKANEYWMKALEIDPNDELVKKNIEIVKEKQKK